MSDDNTLIGPVENLYLQLQELASIMGIVSDEIVKTISDGKMPQPSDILELPTQPVDPIETINLIAFYLENIHTVVNNIAPDILAGCERFQIVLETPMGRLFKRLLIT